MLTVAVGWQVYALTHDPLALGLVGLCEFLPFVSLVLVGGHVADHADRRGVLVAAYATEALCVGTLLWSALLGGKAIWPLYLTIGIFGGTRAFWSPSMQSLLPRLVPRAEFAGAVALNAMLFQIAVIAGPALGGVLFLLGAPVVYGACVLLFATSAVLMTTLRPAQAQHDPADPAEPELDTGHFFEGLRFVLHNRIVLGVISLDLFAVLFGGAVALLPAFASDVLHNGPAGLGLLRSAPGVGAAVTSAALAVLSIPSRAGLWMLGGVALFGVCMITFGLSTSFALSLAVLFLSGGGDMLSVYIRGVLVQLNTPDPIRGRVSAVNSMFIGASNELGEFESGLTARWFGIVPAVVIGGIVTLAVVGTWMLVFPQLRRLQHLR
jgi:MFS family permease